MHKTRFYIYYIISLACAGFLFSSALHAQSGDADKYVRKGDSLRREYRFEESLEAYGRALETLSDSLRKMEIEDRILLSENGKAMSGYVYSPIVVARHRFSLDDFFLYYPLPDKSWRAVPNPLDSIASPFSKAVYLPEESDHVYFSSKAEDGARNIYSSSLRDTIWTVPTLLNEHLTSASDEIYPLLSADGKTLYFSSSGLYGVGGYDIYMSEWNEDEQDWSVPVNMGFPYSSPADDFLFLNTEDGNHTIFASNRDCSADSVWVYVLEYDDMPIRKSVDDPVELQKISALEPLSASERMGGSEHVQAAIPENVDAGRYMDKMAQVRALRDSISFYGTSLEALRERFAESTGAVERQRLTERILRGEAMLPSFQAQLDEAVAELQAIELEFLFSGVVIDPDKLIAEADREIVGEATSYAFSKRAWGEPLNIIVEQPVPKFDYSFKILEQGQFAEDNTIPKGIVYQIQIFSSTSKATVKSLKGLSPVFEIRPSNGRYTYRVGLFNAYNDVLSHLNAVKKAGFRSAFIVAYNDGNELGVSKARALESEKKKAAPTHCNVVIVPSGGELDRVIMDGIRQQAGGKDIARVADADGRTKYVIGAFDSREKADEVAGFARAMGAGEVSVEIIK